jgi:hypothetical protein
VYDGVFAQMRKSKGMAITAIAVAIVCNILKQFSENGKKRRSNGGDQDGRKEVKYKVETISGKSKIGNGSAMQGC